VTCAVVRRVNPMFRLGGLKGMIVSIRSLLKGVPVRRLLAVVLAAATMTLAVTTPAFALYHDRIGSPVLHVLADLATVGALMVPIALLYRSARRTR
jgi:hypothetical protein